MKENKHPAIEDVSVDRICGRIYICKRCAEAWEQAGEPELATYYKGAISELRILLTQLSGERTLTGQQPVTEIRET